MTLSLASRGLNNDASSGEHLLAVDAGHILGVTPAAVRQAVRDGRIVPAHRSPSGVAIFHASDIRAYDAMRRRFQSLRLAFRYRREEQMALPDVSIRGEVADARKR
jgi:hypothetical protein